MAALACVTGLSACSGTSSSGSSLAPINASPTPAATTAPQIAYVVDGDVGNGPGYYGGGTSIKAFPLSSSGNVAPVRVIAGSATGLTDVLDIATDANGSLYVVNGDTVATSSIRIFSAGANGNIAPVRVIAGPQTDFLLGQSVAVDQLGHIFAGEIDRPLGFNGRYDAPRKLLRFPPNADGNVAPEAVMATGVVKHIIFDSSGRNLVESEDTFEPSTEYSAIETFPRDFTSTSRAVYGVSYTGGQPIADDPTTASYYVAFGGSEPVILPRQPIHIVRYAESENGSFGPYPAHPPVALSRLLSACNVRGIAVDAAQELVTTGSTGLCDMPAINFYAARVSGSVPPLRTIAGPLTTLTRPASIAIGI